MMIEPQIHSFVVKIWLEQQLEKTDALTWHGYIIHVASNERLYIRNLQSIVTFIRGYLIRQGMDATDLDICEGDT